MLIQYMCGRVVFPSPLAFLQNNNLRERCLIRSSSSWIDRFAVRSIRDATSSSGQRAIYILVGDGSPSCVPTKSNDLPILTMGYLCGPLLPMPEEQDGIEG